MVIFENTLERELLSKLEEIVQKKKLNIIDVRNGSERVSKHDVEALQRELERLNYSWQKGRIKTVEQYDKEYDALMAKIEEANEEQNALHGEPDYEKIQQVLSDDWKEIYSQLDAEHKRAFWRSFIDEIQLEWSKDVKRIKDIIFF